MSLDIATKLQKIIKQTSGCEVMKLVHYVLLSEVNGRRISSMQTHSTYNREVRRTDISEATIIQNS